AAISGGRIFRATTRSSRVSRARMTAAMPPTPSGSINSKWASRRPRSTPLKTSSEDTGRGRPREMMGGAVAVSGEGGGAGGRGWVGGDLRGRRLRHGTVAGRASGALARGPVGVGAVARWPGGCFAGRQRGGLLNAFRQRRCFHRVSIAHWQWKWRLPGASMRQRSRDVRPVAQPRRFYPPSIVGRRHGCQFGSRGRIGNLFVKVEMGAVGFGGGGL